MQYNDTMVELPMFNLLSEDMQKKKKNKKNHILKPSSLNSKNSFLLTQDLVNTPLIMIPHVRHNPRNNDSLPPSIFSQEVWSKWLLYGNKGISTFLIFFVASSVWKVDICWSVNHSFVKH